ncbi:hypothetical protein [Magnetospirillum molischianum]|uniref:Uncharacterized protein n=1 Tax=Magnetospirillum molischianum DSM 120 TaxID=1150626 RepID=H8FT88_MAGML|nr:hypothetical protein [Magnetospirillum molischianum]CCG41576.1 hypothetical protein PHAMO_280110 [Magnetospirillum molischianum DSM 120]
MVMIPEIRGAGKEWSWPVFIRPSFIPVGMLCLTDVIDHEGRHIFGAAWPDITKPISTPSESSPKILLGGLGSVGMGQHKPTPSLDPIHNEMIKEAVKWTRQLLHSLNDASIVIDEKTGDEYKLNRSLWASRDGTIVLTSGRIPPGLGISVGWVYVREDMLKAVWEVKATEEEIPKTDFASHLDAYKAWEADVLAQTGKKPPLQTLKPGTKSAEAWGKERGLSRCDVVKVREMCGHKPKRGRPTYSPDNSHNQ